MLKLHARDVVWYDGVILCRNEAEKCPAENCNAWKKWPYAVYECMINEDEIRLRVHTKNTTSSEKNAEWKATKWERVGDREERWREAHQR